MSGLSFQAVVTVPCVSNKTTLLEGKKKFSVENFNQFNSIKNKVVTSKGKSHFFCHTGLSGPFSDQLSPDQPVPAPRVGLSMFGRFVSDFQLVQQKSEFQFFFFMWINFHISPTCVFFLQNKTTGKPEFYQLI